MTKASKASLEARDAPRSHAKWRLALRNTILLVATLGILVLGLELGGRAFYSMVHDLSFWNPDFKTRFYPPTQRLLRESVTRNDGTFDILLLGASVLHPRFGSVVERLEKGLQDQGRSIRIHNVSEPSHSSLDSLLKYRLLKDMRFDLVVFYEAINEARANNAPDSVFRPDYTHIMWYELVQHPMHDEPRVSALWYFVEYSLLKIRLRLNEGAYTPQGTLREDWVVHGKKLKSPSVFRANLQAILDIASERGDRVLLMTYAIDEEHTVHGTWGAHQNTIAAVRAHNRALLELAAIYDVPVINQYKDMPRGNDYFSDICHLTAKGSQAFVDRMLPTLVEIILARRP